MTATQKICRVLLLASLLIALGGCVLPPASSDRILHQPLDPNQGRVSVYLSGNGFCPAEVELLLSRFEIYRDGLWLPLAADPITVRSQELRDRQALLGVSVLPSGTYTAVRFAMAASEGEEGRIVELKLSSALSLSAKDSTCLFLEWNLDACLEPEGDLPLFSARPQAPQVSGELLYVVCDDIDTLYFVRTDLQQVAGSLGIPGRPGDLQLDARRNRIYLLGSEARVLYVIDATNNRMADGIPLPALMAPRFIAINPEGTFAWITDTSTGRLVQVDLRLGLVVRETTLGVRPERLIYFEIGGVGRLAVSSPGTQAVLIVDPLTLATLRSLPVDLDPAGLLADGETLYAADRGSDTVFAFGARNFRQIARIAVGSQPVPLAVAPGGRIYAGNVGSGTLSAIAPGQYAALREVPVGPPPFDLAIFSQRRLLYTAHRQMKSVGCFDLTAEEVLAQIPLGGTPFALLVQE